MDFVILIAFLAFCAIAISIVIRSGKYTCADFDEWDISDDLCDGMLSLDETKKQISHMEESDFRALVISLKKNKRIRSITRQVLSDLDNMDAQIAIMEDLKAFCKNEALVSSSVEDLKRRKQDVLENCRSIMIEVFSTNRRPDKVSLEDLNYTLIHDLLEKNNDNVYHAKALVIKVSQGPVKAYNNFEEWEIRGLLKNIEQKAVSQ